MKNRKRKVALTAGAVGASAALLSSCVPSTVYGPPPETPASTVFRPEENIVETVYGPPEYFNSFVPEENIPEDVYGPPMFFEEADSEGASGSD